MRTGVGIILLNNKNQVFVGKRKDNPGNKWQMPQGGVDKGEDFLEAMKRELYEETSVKNIEIIKEIEKEYEEYKEHWLKRNLEKMYELFPKTKGKVIYKNIGSPLSNEYYLGRSASYGLDPDTSRFSSKPMELLRPKIEGLEGMWMVGQDVATAGWAGALSSALMTSMAMVGYGFMDLIVYDRNIIDDLMTLPRLPARGNSGEKEEEKKKEK